MTMAQPSSVQREPSMEEILASIRRIIEDNETSRKDEKPAPQPASHAARVEPAVRAPAANVAEARAATIKPDAAALPAVEPEAAPQVEQPAAQPISFFSDVVSIRPAVQPDPIIAEREEPTPVQAFEREVEEVEPSAPKVEVRQTEVQQPAEVVSPAEVEPKAEDAPDLQPIVSEHSERKIALAFGELNEAYEASRRKSLADAAEEMLRPMLREWIDENLPQMVERLVREEIERIARKS